MGFLNLFMIIFLALLNYLITRERSMVHNKFIVVMCSGYVSFVIS